MDTHKYTWLAGALLLAFFIGYAFWYDHKETIYYSEEWNRRFRAVGIDPRRVTHDDGMWYYDRKSTCVNYGDGGECPRHEGYCAGGKTYGTLDEQVLAVKEALENGGTHPECTLIYAGAN